MKWLTHSHAILHGSSISISLASPQFIMHPLLLQRIYSAAATESKTFALVLTAHIYKYL
jgi:hypothetical protein